MSMWLGRGLNGGQGNNEMSWKWTQGAEKNCWTKWNVALPPPLLCVRRPNDAMQGRTALAELCMWGPGVLMTGRAPALFVIITSARPAMQCKSTDVHTGMKLCTGFTALQLILKPRDGFDAHCNAAGQFHRANKLPSLIQGKIILYHHYFFGSPTFQTFWPLYGF